ncbi:MAG TPA: diacylglycerol kinase family protein [Blastocatellia bacterium]|nr:diacylglycerol kinase family protein [Blastocatellia bacterium]
MLIADLVHQETRMDVIVNAGSGTDDKSDVEQRLADAFTAAGIDARIRIARGGDELVKLGRQALESGAQTLVAGGGDGTISAIAGIVAGTDARLGVLPLGTLNHFAKDLGIPLDLAEAVRNLIEGRTVSVDVGEVNGRVFINNSSLGIYPKLVRMRERIQRQGLGKWRAFVVAFITVLRRYPLVAVRLVAEGQRFVRRTSFVLIGNNEYETTSFRMGGRSRLDGGTLSVYTAPVRRRFELFKLFVKAFFGRIQEDNNFDRLCATEVWAETRRRTVRVALDGEVLRLRTPLRYRVRPGALRVIVPQDKKPTNDGGER